MRSHVELERSRWIMRSLKREKSIHVETFPINSGFELEILINLERKNK